MGRRGASLAQSRSSLWTRQRKSTLWMKKRPRITTMKIGKRKYENYTNEQVNVMKKSLQLDMNTRNIKKSLKNQDLIADDKMPATSSFYHKIN